MEHLAALSMRSVWVVALEKKFKFLRSLVIDHSTIIFSVAIQKLNGN